MIDKDPLGYSVVTYAWVLLLSVWGGVVNFIQRLKRGEAKAHNIVELIGELVISAFVGIVTFYLCDNNFTKPISCPCNAAFMTQLQNGCC